VVPFRTKATAASDGGIRGGVSVFQNRILGQLKQHDLSALGPLVRLELRSRDRLEEPGEPPAHVYFLETGVAVVAGPEDQNLDAGLGLIGSEGMTGTGLLYGDSSPVNRSGVLGAAAASYGLASGHYKRLLDKDVPISSFRTQGIRLGPIRTDTTSVE
jgi:hypothetical protein